MIAIPSLDIKHLIFLFGLLTLASCFPPGAEVSDAIVIDLNNPEQQKVRNFQDQLQADSLVTYLNSKNPTLRYLAAMGFGSFANRDAKKYIPVLAKLLEDEYYDIRTAAAFSLGQMRDDRVVNHLTKAFQKEDTTEIVKPFRKVILEAVGKSANKEMLPLMAAVEYPSTDTLISEGQALGIYQFGLRGIVDPLGTKRMLSMLLANDQPDDIKSIAANYFFRNKDLDNNPIVEDLIRVFSEAEDPRTRMALAVALGRTKNQLALDALFEQYPKEQDYRVKCNILRGLSNFDYREVDPIFSAALNSRNYHISKMASQFFLNKGKYYDARRYIQKFETDSTLHQTTKYELAAAALKHLPFAAENTRYQLQRKLEKTFLSTMSIQEKKDVLFALGAFAWNYRKIFELAQGSENQIVQSKAIEILKDISNRPDFNAYFGLSRNRVRREMAVYFSDAISSGNVGAICEAASALLNPERNYVELYDGTSFLTLAKTRLDLPKEIEAFDLLQAAIDHFNGVKNVDQTATDLDYAIDWESYEQLSAKPRLEMKTSRGEIKLELFKEVAPGSVVNIVQLANSGFFNGLNFHRVVSNFVVQGGCPRGDGYGGLDYSIRSEFSLLHYDRQGYLGMASAGPHTECTQFFITHSPTLHLDGKYTILGRVTEGMDVLHKLEPSDKIISLTEK